MNLETRQFGSIPCDGCGRTLVVTGAMNQIPCDACDRPSMVPDEVRDDAVTGRVSSVNALQEAEGILTALVEATGVRTEIRRRWLLLYAFGTGVIVGWGLFTNRSETLALAIGSIGAFLLALLSIAWTVQWIHATNLAAAAEAIRPMLLGKSRRCPACKKMVQTPAVPSEFECVACRTRLLSASGLVVTAEPEVGRKLRWLNSASAALPGLAFSAKMTRSQWAFLVFGAALMLACLAAWAWFG